MGLDKVRCTNLVEVTAECLSRHMCSEHKKPQWFKRTV